MNSKASILAVSLIAATGMTATVLAQTGTGASGSTGTGVATGTSAASGSTTAAGTGSATATTTGTTAATGTGITTGAAATTSGEAAADAAEAQARLAARFTAFAGSQANAQSLVTGLRTGSPVTLTGTAVQGQPANTTTFTPPTKPMGVGDVFRALTLARRDLAAQGIKSPTPAQIQVALMGGTLTTAGTSSQPVALKGVLQLRSQGMGWGQVASALGVRPGTSMASIRGEDHRSTARVAHRESAAEEAAEHARAAPVHAHVVGRGIVTAAGVQVGSRADTSAGERAGGHRAVSTGVTSAAGSPHVVATTGQGITTAGAAASSTPVVGTVAGSTASATTAASGTTSMMASESRGITTAGGGLFAGMHGRGR